jgi:methionyl-tRNA formyltransferase
MTIKNNDLKIIFLGTPLFAVASLDILVKHGFNVAAVVTAPDKPAGRGQQMHQSEVKTYALQKQIPVFQPEKLGDNGFLNEVKAIGADLQIVVAFRMMPEKLWSMPPLGTFNLHASLLPQYRGAAPINHAIMQGEKETGVTTFFLKHEIDTGDILFQEKIAIGENETAGELHDRLMVAGAKLVLKTTEHICRGEIESKPQQAFAAPGSLKAAPKIFKNDCIIEWSAGPQKIHDFIRGLSPHPAAFTELMDPNGKKYQLRIFKGLPVSGEHQSLPGMVETDRKNYLRIFCTGGYIEVLELQLAGKKKMSTGELLRGFHIDEEWRAV